MREPYETLLGPYRDHWLLWRFLEGEVPDFDAMYAVDRVLVDRLSSGELLMVRVALAFWNGDPAAKVADLAILDGDHLYRVVRALEHTCGVRR